MKNATYRANVSYEIERVFDVEDTYNDTDFFNNISELTDEYFSNREENEDVSNLADNIRTWISDVQNGEMTEAGFVSSVYEFLEGDDW
jgi:hypothetical protein